MQELTQNLWERYGFSANPFDTKALSLSDGALLSVSDAYVSRGKGSEAADKLLKPATEISLQELAAICGVFITKDGGSAGEFNRAKWVGREFDNGRYMGYGPATLS